jgi:sugar/nucleoside kinase (ribokinase family)
MHRLGLKVGWAADFGSDEYSQFALQCTRQEGLDERLFAHHNRPLRRLSVAVSFPQDRLFITYYDPDPAIPAAMKALVTTSAKVLFVPALSWQTVGCRPETAPVEEYAPGYDGNAGMNTRPQLGSLINREIARAVKSCAIFLPNAPEAA